MARQRQQFAVIGLGPFSRTLCKALLDMGHEVMAIDPHEDVVRDVHDAAIATTVVQADPESLPALRELDIAAFDGVIVGRGTDFEASVLTVINLMELGVKRIVAKAVNERHAQVLERVGGDVVRVVNPEHDVGIRLALQLSGQDFVEAVWADPDYSFIDVPVPPALVGRSLVEAQVRKQYGVLVVGVRRGIRFLIAPEPETRLEAGDRVVLLGPNARLDAFGK